MKIYGESTYKGFVLAKDPKDPKKFNKHFISHVTYNRTTGTYSIWIRGRSGDECISDYKMGSNKKADYGIKTWDRERKKQGRNGIRYF